MRSVTQGGRDFRVVDSDSALCNAAGVDGSGGGGSGRRQLALASGAVAPPSLPRGPPERSYRRVFAMKAILLESILMNKLNPLRIYSRERANVA